MSQQPTTLDHSQKGRAPFRLRVTSYGLRIGILLALLAALFPSPTPTRAATFAVTTTANSGGGSLRQAILDANASPGADTITFAIGATGSQQTIQPTAALPAINDPVTIDGWSQGGSGYTGPPLIELNGALAGSSVKGLHITGGGSVVRGLVINGFLGSFASGIYLHTGGSNWIYGNYIGTDFAGATRIANQRGIWIEGGSSANRIGTNADGVNDAAERNVISANIDQNIWIYQPATTGNLIMGNTIGLNAAGTAAVGANNQTVAATGILVQEASYTVIGTDGDGQGDALEGNFISGSIHNINLTGTSVNMSHHNRVSGNLIGTNAAGTASVGIQVEGVRVYVTEDNVIGTDGDGVSDALEGNLISGHSDWGILFGQTTPLNNVIAGNKIGTDITGLSAIANGFGGSPRGGIYLGGYGNLIGSNFDGVSDDLERNLISGNANVSTSGILSQFVDQPGAVPNTIAGNWIGVDATGLTALPNNIGISGASQGLLVRNNVVAANTFEGVSLNLTGSVLTGNRIGVGADGVTPLGNGYTGIRLTAGNDNQIGGTGPGEANIIAHNGYGSANFPNGVRVNATALRNSLRGNRIFANAQLGIDLLNPAGVNINDPDDPDTGGNNLQNYPVITFAQAYADGTTVIQGTLDSNPNTEFTLDFYYSSEADPTGYGEGEFYLGETSVTTNADGDAEFDVTLPAAIPPDQFVSATATHADGSTSEFSLAYAAGGVLDVPIAGLALQASLPIYKDLPAQFSASVNAGTGVSYDWDFGDGGLGSGAVVAHTFTAPGNYTVTVTAVNNSSSAITNTLVSVLEPANINGFRWIDRDGDGFFGLGETINTVGQGIVITATLQEPPYTALNANIVNGSYQIFTPQAGVYLVEATNLYVCSIIANCNSSPSPVAVAMGADGGTEVNFGIMPVPFVPQPDDDGYIVGRAWLDSNANGYPDPNEFPLNSYTVRLLDANGNQLATHVTGSSWSHGSYAFRISEPGLYRVQMNAASGIYPASREVEVYVADMNMVSVQLPFAAGGTIGGQVSDSSGTAVSGAALNLQPGNLQPLFFPGGSYGFFGLDNGNYTLLLTPPANYVTADGVTQRFVPATLNGSAVENWTLLKKGELTIKAVQVVNGQALPINFLPFELLLNGSQVRVAFTNAQGEALVEGLAPGTYTVRPYGEIANLIPGLQLTPAERTAVVSNDSAATLNFSGALSRSLNMFCQLPVAGQPGFACTYEVRTLSGSLLDFGSLPASQPTTSNWNLNPATLEVRLIPDPAVPGQAGWPTHSQIVVIADNTHANVYYPFNPTNPQTIAGYAFWDRCVPLGVRANGNSCTESNVSSNNGIPVALYDANGTEIASTLTTQGSNWNSGYFSFPNLPVGTYRARVDLPPGYAPTTGVERWYELTGVGAVELLEVGYQLNESQAVNGRVFFDNNGNGAFDEAWDDPIAGAAIVIATPGGQAVANPTTGANGWYSQSPINSGEYRVTLTHAGQTWTRDASVPLSGGVPLIDFAVPPEDSRPRVLVFIDGNHNGAADAGEQRLADVSVRLRDAACGGSGAELQTAVTDSGGVAVFNPPPTGFFPVCAQITAGLPADLLPASPSGVNVPRSGDAPVALAVQPANTLLLRAFLDGNGNGSREAGEAYLSGGSATVNGVTKSISSSGATFYLPSGSYPVQFTPPAGYASLWSLPIGPIVTNNAPQTLFIPLRDAGSVSGKVWPPDPNSFSLGGGSLAVGLAVQLQNIASNVTVETTSGANGSFSFSNLAPATYRLRLPAPPPGYVADSEPLITYQSGQILSNNNLNLVPTGHVVGVVYNDSNGNQQWDSNEPSVSQYSVRLVGAGGQQVAVAAPDAAGYFRFEGLNANTPYALQLAGLPSGAFLTSSPGVFTVGAAPTTVQLGIGVAAPPAAGNQYVTGIVRYQQGEAFVPIAGARVIYYAPVNGSCNVANPIIQYDQYTGLDGGYGAQGAAVGCFKVVDVPGFNNSSAYYWGWCTSSFVADCFLINGGYGRYIDVTLTPVVLQARASDAVQVAWSAFRDDNGNGYRDADEPGLAGVTLAGSGDSGVSGQTGWGEPLTLADGRHTLTVTPPAGYVVNGPATRQIAVQGADVALPAIPLRPAGLTVVQAFVDLDGDGEQDEGEAGVSGVSVTLSGPAPANGVTSPNGRVQFAGLPDGSYTATVAPPAGFAAIPARSVTLAQGGVLPLPLQLAGQVSGVVYFDWDGDGHQQPDEPRVGLPLTLTLSSGAGTQLAEGMGGLGLFLGTPAGSYTLAATTPAVQGQAITLAAGEGNGAALSAVGPGQVRGAAWLDGNRDGLRQSWETPLAGIQVTLASATEVTGADGRFVFRDIAPGTYTLSAALPAGLTATLGPVTVSSQRGAVVGIPAAACLDFNGNGRTDVQDVMQVAARWNDPAAYDPAYDIAPPFGSPIDILDISAIAEAWDSACQ